MDQCVRGAQLVVGQAGAWDVLQHLEAIGRLHVHRHIVQHLVVQGVRTVKLKNKTIDLQIDKKEGRKCFM